MCFVRNTNCKNDLVCRDHIKITLLVSEFEEMERFLLCFQEMRKKELTYSIADDNIMLSRIYEKMAVLCYKLRLESLATDYYAFSAITAERMEEWRRISYLWYSAYSPGHEESVVDYNDFNTLQHTYPTISFEKWRSLSKAEKKARALQYSAYSEDNYNGPVDSYWIYFNAWEEYYTAGILDRAIECLVSATNRYVQAFRQLDPKVMNAWKVALNHPEIKRYDDLILRAFEEIYRNLNLNSANNADFFYIECKKIEHRKLLQNKKYFSYMAVKSWAILTKYGMSIYRLVALTVIMIHLIFPVAFLLTPVDMSFSECLMVSINVFFSIKFETEICWIFFLIEIVEIFYSYMILVAISTWLLRKFLNNYS